MRKTLNTVLVMILGLIILLSCTKISVSEQVQMQYPDKYIERETGIDLVYNNLDPALAYDAPSTSTLKVCIEELIQQDLQYPSNYIGVLADSW